MTATKNKVSLRKWLIFIIVGIAGQLAWSLENMYLNSFLFDLGYSGYQDMIFWTEALSAITACITTLFIGSLTDKIGKRKMFICLGYLLWGISTAAFGLINGENVSVLLNVLEPLKVASIFVVVLDCIMTFFGSSANDASFNSYVTKNVDNKNRGKVEGVISVLPLMSMLLITILYSFTGKEHWDLFFYIIGIVVFIAGLISLFLIPKEKVEKNNEKFLSILIEGFKPSTIKKNPSLYIVLICDLIYCVAAQVFFPYMIIYFNKTLGFVDVEYLILLGSVLIIGSILAIIGGFILDKTNKTKMLVPFSIIFIGGCLLITFINDNLILGIVFGTIMMFGYIIMSVVINSLIRDKTPKGNEGIFQGVRMIFQVALPMIIGPYIGKTIVSNFSTETYINDFGEIQNLPNNYIWYVAALIMVLIFIPTIILILKEKKKVNKGIIYDQDQ